MEPITQGKCDTCGQRDVEMFEYIDNDPQGMIDASGWYCCDDCAYGMLKILEDECGRLTPKYT